MRKINVGVIGDAGIERDSELYFLAENLGKTLIDNNYRIISGGMSGIMEAVAKGAKNSSNYTDGSYIGILPGFDPSISNKFADVVIPTGLDTYRNAIVANSDIVVAMGGRAGTLSEIAFAWTFKRMILAYDVVGWSGKLAGTRIDDRKRIEWDGDRVFKVKNEKDVIETINNYYHFYNKRYIGLYTELIKNNYKI